VRLRLFKRYRDCIFVSDSHLSVDPSLINQRLASYLRRSVAFFVDLIFMLILTLCLICVSLKISSPKLVSAIYNLIDSDSETLDEPAGKQLLDLYAALEQENPGILPEDIKRAVSIWDYEYFKEEGGQKTISLTGDFFSSQKSEVTEAGHIILRSDITFTGKRIFFSGFSSLLVYFTFLLWLGKGQTPGKKLMGIRVVKLSGAKISLMDAFERAGGYSASLSTCFLGFLDIFRAPNRQTLHDRVCGTVVIRSARINDQDNQ